MCFVSSVPQPTEGTRSGGARGGARGAGNPHARHAAAHGGREHHADALDQEDYSGGRALRAAALPHTAVGRSPLQGVISLALK